VTSEIERENGKPRSRTLRRDFLEAVRERLRQEAETSASTSAPADRDPQDKSTRGEKP
jgi:hypothetical protein